MEEEVEHLIDSYYEDSVEMKDEKFLIFKRISDYRRTERDAAVIYLEDRTLGTSVELGLYFDAEWKFITPMTEKLFWSSIKQYPDKVKEIFDRIRERAPQSKNRMVHQIYFSKLKSRIEGNIEKLSKVFNSEIQDDNDQD